MDQVKMGKLIAKIRKEKDMTQDELGELLGINGKAVSKWECGINPPDISILIKLSELLEVEVGDLLKGKYPADKIEEERLRKIEEANKEKNKKRKIKITLVFTLILIVVFSIFLTSITRKKVTSEFKTIRFNSNDTNYSISGKILSTDIGKIVILDNLIYQNENQGTDKEPLVKSVQLFLTKEQEIIINYNFDETLDDYGKVKYYNLSHILENIPNKVYELNELNITKSDELDLEIIYINEANEEIHEKINLDVIF